ncbi:MAG: SH3 domain-containing protein [Clostridiales bacterium]|nr:SH3 domain-containing protein [Clostridiales bacterium]
MHTRFIAILLSVMLVVSLASSAAADAGYYSTPSESSATVNNPDPADRLNLRTGASEDSPTLGKYYNGTVVEVLGEEKSGWVKIRFCNLVGYMQKKYLAFGQEQPQVTSAIPSVTIKNTSGTGLNLREKQSTNSPSLGLCKNGDSVLVYGVGKTWCHVQAGEQMGFMLREKLSPLLEFDKGTGKKTVTAQVNNPNPEDRLNLRTSPNTSAPVLGKYYNGVRVELLGAEKNGWIQVRFGKLTGYMQAKFLELDDSHFINSVLPSYTIKNTAGKGLNLREAQSTKSNSLGFYSNGDTGWIYGVGETWCHVQAPDGKVGFMLRESLLPVPEFDKGK